VKPLHTHYVILLSILLISIISGSCLKQVEILCVSDIATQLLASVSQIWDFEFITWLEIWTRNNLTVLLRIWICGQVRTKYKLVPFLAFCSNIFWSENVFIASLFHFHISVLQTFAVDFPKAYGNLNVCLSLRPAHISAVFTEHFCHCCSWETMMAIFWLRYLSRPFVIMSPCLTYAGGLRIWLLLHYFCHFCNCLFSICKCMFLTFCVIISQNYLMFVNLYWSWKFAVFEAWNFPVQKVLKMNSSSEKFHWYLIPLKFIECPVTHYLSLVL